MSGTARQVQSVRDGAGWRLPSEGGPWHGGHGGARLNTTTDGGRAATVRRDQYAEPKNEEPAT